MTTATIAGLLAARETETTLGLRLEDDTWTWAEVVTACGRWAAWLHATTEPGAHVGVLAGNRPELVFLLGGLALSGRVGVLLNPTRNAAGLAADVATGDCTVLVHDGASPELAGLLRDLPADLPRHDLRTATDTARSTGNGSVDAAVPDMEIRPDTLWLLLFTSGTSGAPKAVRATQGRIAGQGAVVAAMAELGPDDVTYTAMPLFHANAIIAGLVPQLVAGGTLALRDRFSASAFLDDVRRFGATFTHYVGAPLAYVLAQPERPDDGHNPLRLAFGNEAPPEVVHGFAERFDCRVIEAYGSSEGGLSVVRVPGQPDGALGRPMGEVRILDAATGAERAPAEFGADGTLINPDATIGEIVRVDSTGGFEGYHGAPKADAARTRNGWYWTGDLGYLDGDGWLYFAGRTDGWARVRGENLATEPIRQAIRTHPAVMDAAVYAVPADPGPGDALVAAIELVDDTTAARDELRSWLRGCDALAEVQRPAWLRFGALPRTATNKIAVADLRREGVDGRVEAG